MEEQIIFFSNLKKFTSPANKFLLHKCSNNRNTKKYIFFKTGKKLQVQQMSFCYINVETNFIFSNLKKFTSPANEFLLHNRNNSKMKKLIAFFQF